MARSRRGHSPARKRSRAPAATHTSVPTGRAAYADTRKWLLATHGPVCAYCGLTYPARELTLDHVTPRRGQSAYDRRDNLVLACKRCNAAKADKSFVAWVLGARTRAVHLYRYGQHLSDGILEMLRPMVGEDVVREVADAATRAPRKPASRPARKSAARAPRHVFGPSDGDSPYDEPSPYLDAPAPPPLPSGPVMEREPAKRRRGGRRGGRRHKKRG
ncbi:MAG TPA: HNH endonuclease signature motif containing protein [Gemmatimonadaceae bacterium]|nr:HNH endonuclease signature motif containing protein [Gemmatimonadaceae bacterium]